MPNPAQEALRNQVAEHLQKQPPTPYREIQRLLKVSPGFISDVKRQLGQPVQGQKRASPSAPEAPAVALPQEGNGLDEFIPPEDPKAAPKAPAASPRSATPGSASGSARSQPEAAPPAAPEADDRPIYACDEEAGGCGAEWRLKAGEQPVTECPSCGVSLGG